MYSVAKFIKLKNVLIAMLIFSTSLCFAQIGQDMVTLDKVNIKLMKDINKLLNQNIEASTAIVKSNDLRRQYIEKKLELEYKKTGYDVILSAYDYKDEVFEEVKKLSKMLKVHYTKFESIPPNDKKKIEYFNKLSSDGSEGIDFELNHSAITQSNKQEFYQLRRKIVDVYSKRYKRSMKLMRLISNEIVLLDSLAQKKF